MRWLPLLTLTLLAGCFGSSPSTPDAPEKAAAPKGKAKAKAKAGKAAKGKGKAGKAKGKAGKGKAAPKGRLVTGTGFPEGTERPELRPLDALGEDEPALVLLVVTDTVRSDRMHLCGHDKPNTPTFERLRDEGFATTCTAYSPAAWTLPAHASLFTGLPTAEHGVHTHGTPLADDALTLAEIYAERGYQTAFLSANPVFSKAGGGFWQGFDYVLSAKGLSNPLRDSTFGANFGRLLNQVSRQKPLFLVVNLFDAHDPYPAIPEGLDWATAGPEIDLHPHTADENNDYYRFVTGAMPEAEQGPYLASIKNAYDHGIFVADKNLGQLFKNLAANGWLGKSHRIVVTSDHGEHLGEHGLLRHGSHTWETVTKVPFLYKDTTADSPPELAEPFATPNAFELLRDGTLPASPRRAESASAHNEGDFKPSSNAVSLWTGPSTKLTWDDGDWRLLDLSTDPGELNPTPLPANHPLRAELKTEVDAHMASIEKALQQGQDPEVMEMLKEVGYVQ